MMLQCQHCGVQFERPHTRGPVPKFCKNSHRQRAFQLRALERFKIQIQTEMQENPDAVRREHSGPV